jgi:hypothetical protein
VVVAGGEIGFGDIEVTAGQVDAPNRWWRRRLDLAHDVEVAALGAGQR